MIEVTSNYPEWSQVFAAYVRESGMTIGEAVNKKALDAAFRLTFATPRGDKKAIAALPGTLGKVWYGYVVNRIKTGFLTVARNKAAAARVARGKKPLAGRNLGGDFSRANVALASRKLLASRKRAVGFLASGWLPTIAALTPYVPGAKGRAKSGTKQFGSPKGKGTAADVRSDKPTALMQNDAAEYAGSKRAYDLLATAGEAVLAEQSADMLVYVHRKLDEKIRKFTGL